jgi:GAF domain-containing protein
MGKKLKIIGEEDRRRNWVTVGLAQFSDILRSSNDLKILCETILSSLIKYLGANQGGIFLVNETDGQETYLELVACYAYDRKKFLEKKIHVGEGLVGQCLLEKDTIYLTDVPDNYVQITSGTGAATPRCIVIQPIKINDEIVGVFEIASFNVLDKYEMEFLSKLSESVASVVSSVKVNERTVKLLEESRINQESMRSQEEELRQNLEELNATQEEMRRKELEYIDKIALLEQRQ